MGIYLNPGNDAFQETLNSEIYVDKSGLLAFTNRIMMTEQKYLCVSRPRRFGKSVTAKMLAAYYDRSCDSGHMFDHLSISGDDSYEKYRNRSYVLYLDIAWFRMTDTGAEGIAAVLQREVIGELREAFPGILSDTVVSLPVALARISETIGEKFVIIIDEWDCLFREARYDEKQQEGYINLLRGLFKSAPSNRFVKLAYMTGILPIKKYGTQSALNNFNEFTMVNPGVLAEYAGFTEGEVQSLCRRYQMDFEGAQQWYDGYHFRRTGSIYSPRSVVEAMLNREYGSYWTGTETYEALKLYINMDFNGLKDAVVLMLGGGRCRINSQKFQNDMTSIKSRDDVLTLLVHLGYLAYDAQTQEVYIPNREVAGEFENVMEDGGWEHVAGALRESGELLEETWRGDADAVALHLDRIHEMNTSVLSYHNEASLSCVITIAYYSARKDYTLIRELPSGKGFADIAFIPRKHSDRPAMLAELKWDQTAEGALKQIKERNYTGALEDFGEILLIGISYDRREKKHHCVIERWKQAALSTN